MPNDEVFQIETCTDNTHAWPADWSNGDTCDCGKLYLFSDGAKFWAVDRDHDDVITKLNALLNETVKRAEQLEEKLARCHPENCMRTLWRI